MPSLPELTPEEVSAAAAVAAPADSKPMRRASARRASEKISAGFQENKRGPPSPAKNVRKKKIPKLVKCETAPAETAVADSASAEDNGIICTVDGSPSDPAPGAAAEGGNGNAHTLTKDALRLFNKHYLHFVQEEEKRVVEEKAKQQRNSQKENKTTDNGSKKSSSKRPDLKAKSKKKGIADAESQKNPSKRPDLKAISRMQNEKSALYPEKRIGHIPGIDVGHQFLSRAEMVIVGLHQHWLNGIDYIGESKVRASKEMDFSRYKFPLTVSIVLSGQYEDDLDNCDDIVYTGQGGNDLLGNKKQIAHQELKRGNLGLKHCMEYNVPVRVTRGRKCRSSYVGKVYTYDGLYQVVKYWAEEGVSGFTVYKFGLKRMEGQPPLLSHEQIQFSRGNVPKSISEIRGLVCEDFTGGQEDIPIPATNMVDDSPMPPEGFTYIKEMKYNKNVPAPRIASMGCKCEGGCSDPKVCACAKFNGGDLPYVKKDGGRLVEPKSVVIECGPHCGCGPQCVNKTSQRPKYRLEIFRTPTKGWGVRSWDFIPSGAPVCEYIGLMRRTEELDLAADNSYVFDIDCLQTMKGLDGRESRLRDVSLPPHLQKAVEEISETVPFCIDAGQTGNVTRFINHSCQPNLFVQCMLSKHHDLSQARVILVAADNIPPLKELTYDYGYALDSVVGPDGEIRRLPCYCGAEGCRKRLY